MPEFLLETPEQEALAGIGKARVMQPHALEISERCPDARRLQLVVDMQRVRGDVLRLQPDRWFRRRRESRDRCRCDDELLARPEPKGNRLFFQLHGWPVRVL